MAKVTGPALSIGARGQIAKSLVYGVWRGVKYARQHVVPNNPRSTAQTLTRSVFSAIDATWKRLLTNSQAPWEAAAKGQKFVGRNKLISVNLPALRGQSDKSQWVASPGSGGGLPALSVTPTTGGSAGEIDVAATFPGAPVGWTLDSVTVQALPNADPSVAPIATVYEESDSDGDFPVTLTGLTSGQEYVVSIWPVWTRSDGLIVYGPSISDLATAA